MSEYGVTTLVFKRLSPNDNSKNQIYLGSDYSSLQLLPFGSVYTDKSRKDSKRDRFKADLPFFWMDDNGKLFKAPNAQLILYPKYPEVRMSGFLQGAEFAPSEYLRSRTEGRVLILGISAVNRKIIGHLIGPDNPVTRELEKHDSDNVFNVVFQKETENSTRTLLLEKLKEIHDMGWVPSVKLNKESKALPYKAPNGGGYTLEAFLGVRPNGDNEPDYLGWEVKQHSAKLDNPLSGGAITLMTPEPTGGIYQDQGVFQFVKLFGYPDTKGRADRFNFGGIHKFGERHVRTNLTLVLDGYDEVAGKIIDITGGIKLVSEKGDEAATWHFSNLLEKWNRKHAQAVYVPSEKKPGSEIMYRYGHKVALGTGTDFGKFLKSMSKKYVYYDPGIKVEDMSNSPKAKKRSQFRSRPVNIPELYDGTELVDLNSAF